MKRLDFGQESILKNVLLSAGPMMVAQALSLLYNIVDRIYIGRIPEVGLQALGGVGICFPFISFITAFANLYGSGGAPLCAIESGKQNHQEARGYLNTAFILLVVTSFVLMGIGLFFCPQILRIFGASTATLPFALPYMRIYLLGTTFSMIAIGLNPFINAQGFPGIGMMTILVGALSNIVLDPLFIFGFHLGLQGAAWATVLSQLFSAIYVLWFLTSKKAMYPLKFFQWRQDVVAFRIANIVSLGLAGFIMQVTNSIVQIISNNMLSLYGGDLYISVMTVVSSVRQILDTPIFGLADGSGPIISYNYGAKLYLRVKKVIWIMTGLALVYTALVWGLILWIPEAFISLFSQDLVLKEAAVPALNTYFFAFIFQALQYSGQTVFKSLNKKKQAIFFSLFRKIIIVVPLTIYLPQIASLGVQGVFLAEPISNFIGGCACFITMLFTVMPTIQKASRSNS